MKIVNTDNFNGDYPDEAFLSVTNSEGRTWPVYTFPKSRAQAIADILNREEGPNNPRFWKVVDDDYVLQPGFEP